MDLREQLTNQEIKEKFNSDFELVNYAIRIAESMVKSGREPDLGTDVRNYAYCILQMIMDGKDEFIELNAPGDDAAVTEAKEAILRRVAEARTQMADSKGLDSVS